MIKIEHMHAIKSENISKLLVFFSIFKKELFSIFFCTRPCAQPVTLQLVFSICDPFCSSNSNSELRELGPVKKYLLFLKNIFFHFFD